MMQRRFLYWPILACLLFMTAVAFYAFMPRSAAADHVPPGTYVNPARMVVNDTSFISGTHFVESFADPMIIHGNDGLYYAYATTDPLGDWDRDSGGNLRFHRIPMASSTDMVHWAYIGDAFATLPPYAADNAGLWAPSVHFFNGQYYLYFTVTDTNLPGGGSAIGVATSANPGGPWTFSPNPAVEPQEAPCCSGSRRNDFDPFVIAADGQKYIFYGSYFGGISVRQLSADGLTSLPATQVQVAVANKYEAPFVEFHDGYYYLFVSATNCCNGPLTGYSVFAGRSQSITGPYLDRAGISLGPPAAANARPGEVQGRAGGSVVISMNGDKWVGPGHNAVISDTNGQDWFVYHAIARDNPYFADPNPFNIDKRPLLIDRLDWIDGWPTVRAGYWASDDPQPAPGAVITPTLAPRPQDAPGQLLIGRSDEFSGALKPQWSWIRQPVTGTSVLSRTGYFRFVNQVADLYVDSNNAGVLIEDAPPGDFMVETKLDFYLPPNGCCWNFVQAGLVLYQNDDRFLKLVHFSNWDTRQTEWAKENTFGSDGWRPTAPQANFPRYGNTIVGPPAAPSDVPTTTTWLRIAKRSDPQTGEQNYTAYTSVDGTYWERGGTWQHTLSNIKIGLVSMGGGGPASDPNIQFPADFDYVRVYDLAPLAVNETPTSTPPATATAVPTNSATAIPTTTATTMPTSSATAVPTSSATAMPTGTPCPAEPYSDVATGDYFYVAVNWLYCRGATDALPAGSTTFQPYQNASRAVIVKMVVLGNGFPIDASGGQHFSDVPKTNPYYNYIMTAWHRGIISGYNTNPPCGVNSPCFLPNDNVTRGQIAKIVVKAQGWQVVNPATPTFADVPASYPFYGVIETLFAHYVISGYDCGGGSGEPCGSGNQPYYRPGNPATRGQVAKIVYLAATQP